MQPQVKGKITRSFSVSFFLFLAFLLAACEQGDENVIPANAPPLSETVVSADTLNQTNATSLPLQSHPAVEATKDAEDDLMPTPTEPAVASSPTKSVKTPPSPTPPPSPSPSPTVDPYLGFRIEELARRNYGGGEIDIVGTLTENENFKRFLITYPSDGLTIYGYMNVPNEGTKFPVVIMLHGYIPPSEYETVTYTERYANALAEAGYFVIHPNLRNYPPSDNAEDPFRVGMAVDVLNLIAIIREQSKDPNGYLRRVDADDINLWGHSMGGGIVLRAIAVNNAPYIRSAVLYASMSGDEILNYERIKIWSDGQRGDFELNAPPETLQAISPIFHLDKINAATSIHHSQADEVVPPEWSDDLCQRITALGRPAECFFYDDLPHTFLGYGDTIFIQRVIDFFNRH